MTSTDLLIVGPGVLGSVAGTLWREEHPECTVMAQTNTENSHPKLTSLGLQPVKKADAGKEKYPYVLFSAPPSGSQDYPAEVRAALDRWDGSGCFVFTSSGSVCNGSDGQPVTETSQTVPLGAAPSTDRLLKAEEAVLQAGGNVVRLVGLYHRTRGAHTFFLRMGQVERWGGSVVNLIHYEDAARLAVAVLRGDRCDGPGGYRGRVFVGSDNHPLTFQDMMDHCITSGVLQGQVTFTGAEDPSAPQKVVDNSWTRRQLGWEPKFNSFKDFMYAGGHDCYHQQ